MPVPRDDRHALEALTRTVLRTGGARRHPAPEERHASRLEIRVHESTTGLDPRGEASVTCQLEVWGHALEEHVTASPVHDAQPFLARARSARLHTHGHTVALGEDHALCDQLLIGPQHTRALVDVGGEEIPLPAPELEGRLFEGLTHLGRVPHLGAEQGAGQGRAVGALPCRLRDVVGLGARPALARSGLHGEHETAQKCGEQQAGDRHGRPVPRHEAAQEIERAR